MPFILPRPVYKPRSGRPPHRRPVRQDTPLLRSVLADSAEVGAAATDHDALDGRAANAAGLAGARVDVVVELKEARNTIGVHIVGDRGATQSNRFSEDFIQSGAQSTKLSSGETTRMAAGANAGMEERLVRVDIADAVEQRLVEQRSLDRRLALAEERDEVFDPDGERFAAWAFVLRLVAC